MGGSILAYFIGLVLIFTNGVIPFLLVLLAFILANLATSYRIEDKISLKLIVAKKPIRDWRNVFGNGIPIVIFAVLERIYSSDIFMIAFVASIATFLSDTMSTEIGVLSKKEPILVTSLEKTHRGRSGAISLEGTLTGVLSSVIFSLISVYFLNYHRFLEFIIIVSISSVLANFLDSFLGVTLQANYFCDYCKVFSEEKIHTCGNPCRHTSGLKFVNNHVVNFLAILAGGIFAMILSYVIL